MSTVHKQSSRTGGNGQGRPPISKAMARKLSQDLREAGQDPESILAQYRIEEHHAMEPTVTIKPPWAYHDGKVYAAFLDMKRSEGRIEDEQPTVRVMISGGAVYAPEALALAVDAMWEPHEYINDWGRESLQLVLDGEATAPDIAEVFRWVKTNIQWFSHLPGDGDVSADGLAELLALWTMGTYCGPVWNAYPYLHFDATCESCGKTNSGKTIAHMSFWHLNLNGLSTVAEWRDSSHFGRTILLDDISPDDPTLKVAGGKTLLNGGYKRGTPVRLKGDPDKDGRRTTKVVDLFAPRIFACVWPMDAMLRSRCIRVMMQRSENEEITRRDPNSTPWPHSPAKVRDAMYTWSYLNMAKVEEVYKSKRVEVLSGRGHELARPLLTMAAKVEDAGEHGLFERVAHVLEVLDTDSVQERLEASGYADVVRGAWACASAGNLKPTTQDVFQAAGGIFAGLAPKDIGRTLDGCGWARHKRTGQGRYWLLDNGTLAAEAKRLGLSDRSDTDNARVRKVK